MTISISVEGQLPDLTTEELQGLQNKKMFLPIPAQVAKERFPDQQGALYLTWCTAQHNKDPWFEVVDGKHKTVSFLEGKEEYDTLYNFCSAPHL